MQIFPFCLPACNTILVVMCDITFGLTAGHKIQDRHVFVPKRHVYIFRMLCSDNWYKSSNILVFSV